jgi:hypothetical protein
MDQPLPTGKNVSLEIEMDLANYIFHFISINLESITSLNIAIYIITPFAAT